MTLQVGDKVVTIPLRDGGRVTVRSGTLSVGDKAVLIPGANGQLYAVRPASPQVGDKVIVYPLRNGGHVCLASADDDGGGSSPSVMPPGNFHAMRTGPGTADLDWLPGEGNTAVRIVRRPDRYPVHINDGTVAYEGAGREATDIGLGFRDSYYYCAWGKAGSSYSNGYLMDRVWPWGSYVPGTYYLSSLIDFGVGEGGTASSFTNALGNDPNSWTLMGYRGWFEARFEPGVDFTQGDVQVTVAERTGGVNTVTLNPMNYLSGSYHWIKGAEGEEYDISFRLPNIVRIESLGGKGSSGSSAYGNIVYVKAVAS